MKRKEKQGQLEVVTLSILWPTSVLGIHVTVFKKKEGSCFISRKEIICYIVSTLVLLFAYIILTSK